MVLSILMSFTMATLEKRVSYSDYCSFSIHKTCKAQPTKRGFRIHYGILVIERQLKHDVFIDSDISLLGKKNIPGSSLPESPGIKPNQFCDKC